MATKAMRVDGADISHHQSAVNISAAQKAGLKFLYHKATEGTTMLDANYDKRRREAAAAGLTFGAYHFASPDGGDAAAEAKHFLQVAKPKPGDLLPCLDFEQMGKMRTQSDCAAWAAAFTKVVKAEVGVLPVLYGPWDLSKDSVRWIPRYNRLNAPPVEGGWDIWQFSNGVDGVPNSFNGLGHVDLNTFAKGMTMGRLVIPKPAAELNRVLISHNSMQFSDSPEQMRQDAETIFKRAERRGTCWITGTEAGGTNTLRNVLADAAKAHGYRFFNPPQTDAWIAVRKGIIDGGWVDHYEQIIPGKAGRNAAKGVVAVEFDSALGHITVIAAHYMTKGRPDAKSPEYRQYLEDNQRLADAVGVYAEKQGRGTALVFYGGDQNIVDRTNDTFLGQPLTSAWDELERWENTGHGNIDVIASLDRDGRVTAVSIRALTDADLRLNSDHFAVDAEYDVAGLR